MNLYGWDTAYALEIAEANKALAARKDKLIIDFDIDGFDGVKMKANGSFANWTIVEGGSGAILNLRLTIADGTFDIEFGSPKSIDLSGAFLTVAVQLRMLPTGPENENLVFNINKLGGEGEPTGPGVITPIRLDDPSGKLDSAERAILQAALLRYIVDNASKVSYVFASINLYPPETNTWLAPIRSSYAYADREGGSGVLAILSVTTDRDISALTSTIDPSLLSLSYPAAFGISSRMFMEHVLLPVLPKVFDNGATTGSFGMSGNKIVNSLVLKMAGVKSGAITYYPMIDELSIATSGNGLFSNYRGTCDLKAGIEMNFTIDTNNPVIYNPITKGIGFRPDSNPVTKHQAHIPWYWWFLGPIARLVMELIVNTIGRGIVSGLTRDAGEKLTLARNPPVSIKWSETNSMDVEDVGVNDGVYMRGTLNKTMYAYQSGKIIEDTKSIAGDKS